MKIGDLVRHRPYVGAASGRVGLIVEIIQKKCWRTEKLGAQVDFNKVEPEDHAVVVYQDDTLSIPVVDLEVV